MDPLASFSASHAEGWTSLVGHVSWQGTIVGIVALGVVSLGRRWPAPVRYWILLLALVKFVTPPQMAVPSGVFSLVTVQESRGALLEASDRASAAAQNNLRKSPESAGPGAFPVAASRIQNADDRAPDVIARQQTGAPSVATPASSSSAPAPAPSAMLHKVLLLAHLAGTVLVLAGFAIRALRLLRSRRHMVQPPPELVEAVRRISRQMGLWRVPALYLSPVHQVPYSIGILTPAVVLPAGHVHELSAEEMRAVLCHELAHHRRGDLWMNLVQMAIWAMWWFNPVVWLLNRAIRRVREECCDDLLLSRRLVSDETYCATLLRVTLLCGRSRLASAAVVSMTDGQHPLTHRIRRIMDETLPRRERLGRGAVVGLLMLAAVVLPGVRTVHALTPIDAVGRARLLQANTEFEESRPVYAMRSGIARVPMPTGHTAGGRTIDEKQQPVAGVAVRFVIRAENPNDDVSQPVRKEFQATSDDNGMWSIAGLPVNLSRTAVEFSHPYYVGVPLFALEDDAKEQLLKSKFEQILSRGVPVFGHVTDDDGRPVAGATVAIGQYFKNFDLPATGTTGDEGEYRVQNCQAGDSLLTVFKIGLAPHTETVSVGTVGREMNVSLRPGRTVRVRVTDDAGRPIAKARVWPFDWPATVILARLHTFGQTDENGLWIWDWAPDREIRYMAFKTNFLLRSPGAPLGPRIEPHQITLLPETQATVSVVEYATRRREGLVLNADGTPAGDAVVFLGTPANPIELGDVAARSSSRRSAARTDRDGRFRVDVPDGEFAVFVCGTRGFAHVPRVEPDRSADEPLRILLKPWARVEGTLRRRQAVVHNELVTLGFTEVSPGTGWNLRSRLNAKTDRNGRYVFDRVPPETGLVVAPLVTVATQHGPMLARAGSASFKLAAGQLRMVDLGGIGRTVIGRFQLKDDAWAVDWEASSGHLHPLAELANDDVVRRPPATFRVQADGSFQVEDVPVGTYRVAFAFLALKPATVLPVKPGQPRGLSGLVVDVVEVPEQAAGVADEQVDLGKLAVGSVSAPAK